MPPEESAKGRSLWRDFNCQVCGNRFRCSRIDRQFCSGKCRMRYKRKCDAITAATSKPKTKTAKKTTKKGRKK